MKSFVIGKGHQIKIFNLLAVPFHVWYEHKPSNWIIIFEQYSLNFASFLQYIVKPLKKQSFLNSKNNTNLLTSHKLNICCGFSQLMTCW